MDFTPDHIDAAGKALASIIAAIAAAAATLFSAYGAYVAKRGRRELEVTQRDLHIAHDRIRELKGEPLQYRACPESRKLYVERSKHVSNENEAG